MPHKMMNPQIAYVLHDNRLSIEARMLYAYLCSFDDGVPPSTYQMIRQLGIGKTRFYRYRNELEAFGLIVVENKITSGGGVAKYSFPDKPVPTAEAEEILISRLINNNNKAMKGYVRDFPEYVGQTQIPIKPGFKAIFDSDSSSTEKAEGEETENACEFGKVASPYVHEGANKRPQKPTMKWLTKKLEKYNVGTGATRTSTLAEITANEERALMKENKGALTISHNEDQDMSSIKAAYDKIEADGATVEEDLGLKRYRMFQAIAYGETAISVELDLYAKLSAMVDRPLVG